ncbi:MAG TPA: hypothetical protein VFL81_00685, partial [Candidatus Saccharimonadales bacterium]|nr:hypothetical protein [Candidatus Saccharimonadales bacterium]
ELANVLAGMNGQAAAPAVDDNQPADAPASAGLQYEETGAGAPALDTPAAEEAGGTPTLDDLEKSVAADTTALPSVESATPAGQSTTSLSPELDSLKKDAVAELRPLVDKLDLPADEKFDTLLLIIRSTDDQTLLSAAHDAAKAIDDDTKRAQALLDVIKEIDYFANQPK